MAGIRTPIMILTSDLRLVDAGVGKEIWVDVGRGGEPASRVEVTTLVENMVLTGVDAAAVATLVAISIAILVFLLTGEEVDTAGPTLVGALTGIRVPNSEEVDAARIVLSVLLVTVSS